MAVIYFDNQQRLNYIGWESCFLMFFLLWNPQNLLGMCIVCDGAAKEIKFVG